MYCYRSVFLFHIPGLIYSHSSHFLFCLSCSGPWKQGPINLSWFCSVLFFVFAPAAIEGVALQRSTCVLFPIKPSQVFKDCQNTHIAVGVLALLAVSAQVIFSRPLVHVHSCSCFACILIFKSFWMTLRSVCLDS